MARGIRSRRAANKGRRIIAPHRDGRASRAACGGRPAVRGGMPAPPGRPPPLATGRSAKRPCCSSRSYSTIAPATARFSANRVGNAHNMPAARQHRRRQPGALRAEHIGGVQRMPEARQFGWHSSSNSTPTSTQFCGSAISAGLGQRHSGTCAGVAAVSAARAARARPTRRRRRSRTRRRTHAPCAGARRNSSLWQRPRRRCRNIRAGCRVHRVGLGRGHGPTQPARRAGFSRRAWLTGAGSHFQFRGLGHITPRGAIFGRGPGCRRK